MSNLSHIYYNNQFNGIDVSKIDINHLFSTNLFPSIVIKDYRSHYICEDVDKYYMSIIRFKLPCTSIPIFHFFADNNLSVTISYNGTDVQTKLVPTNITTNNIVVGSVYTVQQFINNINTALTTSFNTIQPSLPGSVTEAPYMIYDPKKQSISLIIQKTYDSQNVSVWINSELYVYFNGFQFINEGVPGSEINGKYAQFKVADNKNNTFDATHYILTMEYIHWQYWWDLKYIALISLGNTPIENEDYATNTSQGQPLEQRVIADFVPEVIKPSDMRSTYIYTPVSKEYKLSDSIGRGDLSKLDMGVAYYDKNDAGVTGSIIHPVGLFFGESFTSKMLLRHVNLGIK
jgi:hypothetical protein